MESLLHLPHIFFVLPGFCQVLPYHWINDLIVFKNFGLQNFLAIYFLFFLLSHAFDSRHRKMFSSTTLNIHTILFLTNFEFTLINLWSINKEDWYVFLKKRNLHSKISRRNSNCIIDVKKGKWYWIFLYEKIFFFITLDKILLSYNWE